MQTDITFYEREIGTIKVKILSPDGDPLDLNGLDVLYRVAMRDETLIFDKTEGAGLTIVDAAEGKVEIAIEQGDLDLRPGAYRHELRLTGYNYAETVLVGIFYIEDSLFRRG